MRRSARSGDKYYVHPRRLLLLTARYPYPVIGGDRLRINQIATALRNRFSITLLSLCETKEEEAHKPDDGVFSTIFKVRLPPWRSYLNTLISIPTTIPLQLAYYRSERFRVLVEELLPNHDVALAHLIRTGQYLEHLTSRPRILEMSDAISLNYTRLCQLTERHSWKTLVYRLERARLEQYERSLENTFERIWLTSSVDRDFLGWNNNGRVDVIPNSVNLDLVRRAGQRDTIVFIGNMRTVQNQDACLHFANDILPLVRQRASVCFRVIGDLSGDARRKLEKLPGIELTGRVNRISDHLGSAFCAVSPMRAAAGIQNKVLEYLALGIPCVASKIGCGGIDVIAGIHLLQYETRAEAADQILQIFRNKELAGRLARQGRTLVLNQHAPGATRERFLASAELATSVFKCAA